MEINDLLTVSGNDLTVPGSDAPPEQVEAAPDYTEQLEYIIKFYEGFSEDLNQKLDRLIELQEQSLSQNALPEEEEEKEINVYVTVSQNSVSENTVSENTVSENALVTTPLSHYTVEESLLMIICLLLLLGNILQFFFRKGGSKE
ncbi:MAG: hypothetical protein HDR00_09265 [Lachnospiraceae bacterium]|nr:hypothetical protein [Lachnospiraceae bacterium]